MSSGSSGFSRPGSPPPPTWASEHTEITVEFFCRAFRQFVRVLLDWEQVERGPFAVLFALAQDRTSFDHWYSPWYVDKAGKETSYENPAGTSLSVARAASGTIRFSQQREHLIAELTREYRSISDPLQIVVALYALPNDRFLVLDGNHRLIAATRAECEVTVLTFVLYGPIDPSILPDLAHW